MKRRLSTTGQRALAAAMKECNIEYFFYVEGGMATLFPEISRAGINTILCRNEKAACSMADGYSRVARKPSVCYAQHGAAAAILSSLLYEPMFAHSPVVALTGSTPTMEKDQWRYQEVYEKPYFEPTCKFNVDVTDAERLADYFRIASQIAVSGCPGPTHVGMHNDMATKQIEMDEVVGDPVFFTVPPFRPRPEPNRIAEACKLLFDAERPVMVCGSGVHISSAYDEVKELAELMSIPVATNYSGKGCFPENHPLSLGVIGVYGRESTNRIVREADVVFFVSTRAGSHMTDEFTAPGPGGCKVIHLDIDPVVIGRIYKVDVPLVGDTKVTLQEMLSYSRSLFARKKSRNEYLNQISKLVGEYEKFVTKLMSDDKVPIKPQRLMEEVSKAVCETDIIVSDTGQMVSWTTRLLKVKRAGLNYLCCSGSLGSSLPLALGASFAAANNKGGGREQQRILNLIGDGGVVYNIADLETALRYNDRHAPFVVVVNNNSTLGSSRGKVADKGNPRGWVEGFDFLDLDYARVAESFGCFGIRVERPSEIAEAIRAAFDSGKPSVVDVATDKTEYAPIGPSRMSSEVAFPSLLSY